MKLGKRQEEVLEHIRNRGYWCYGQGPFRGGNDAAIQRVCEALEKMGLLESYERQHPLGFAKTTAWRLKEIPMQTIGTLNFDGEILVVKTTRYSNGNTAIAVTTDLGEPYSTVSTNTDNKVGPGEFVVSHNIAWTKGFQEALMAAGLFEDTGRRVDYGYIQGQPVWRVKEPS